MTVTYSCQMYLYCASLVLHIWLNGSLHLLNLNALTRFLRLQTECENDEPCEHSRHRRIQDFFRGGSNTSSSGCVLSA